MYVTWRVNFPVEEDELRWQIYIYCQHHLCTTLVQAGRYLNHQEACVRMNSSLVGQFQLHTNLRKTLKQFSSHGNNLDRRSCLLCGELILMYCLSYNLHLHRKQDSNYGSFLLPGCWSMRPISSLSCVGMDKRRVERHSSYKIVKSAIVSNFIESMRSSLKSSSSLKKVLAVLQCHIPFNHLPFPMQPNCLMQ